MPKPLEYPPPLVIPPISTHEQTIIILHGRGSTAESFASPLLTHPASTLEASSTPTFKSHFTHTKFIFPTAPLRRAVAYNRSFTHQWFDMYPLDTYSPEHKQDIQLKGLSESVAFLHQLMEGEVKEIGAENVVLMGLSQGCAVGLVSLMLWEGERLGAFVGMCGWLPLRKSMREALQEEENGVKGEDVFERAEDHEAQQWRSEFQRATEWLQEELDCRLESTNLVLSKKTPIFLGHGTQDDKVPIELGGLAAAFLQEVGLDVEWKEYLGLGHWYSQDMLRDIVQFLGRDEDIGMIAEAVSST